MEQSWCPHDMRTVAFMDHIVQVLKVKRWNKSWFNKRCRNIKSKKDRIQSLEEKPGNNSINTTMQSVTSLNWPNTKQRKISSRTQ